MNPANEQLLNDYSKNRSLSGRTLYAKATALKNWDLTTEAPLAEADVSTISAWYQSVKSQKPGTILTYTVNLRSLHLYAKAQVMKKREAEATVKELWDTVPVTDLTRNMKLRRKDGNKLLTSEEIKTLIESASHPRIQSLLSMMAESGARKGELLNMKIKDLTFGPEYVEARISGKTGERTIALIGSVSYLKAWLAVHPDRRPDQYLFVVNHAKGLTRLNDSSLNGALQYIAKKNGIKSVNPHMLRHTLLTNLAKGGVSDSALRGQAGWSASSKMTEVYIHMSGRDHINAVLKAQGLSTPEPDRVEPILKLVECPNCHGKVGEALFCGKCGAMLDEKMRIEAPEKARSNDKRMAEMELQIAKLIKYTYELSKK